MKELRKRLVTLESKLSPPVSEWDDLYQIAQMTNYVILLQIPTMQHSLKKRVVALESKAKPPVISTVLDLINSVEDNEDVELSPELQKLVEKANQ